MKAWEGFVDGLWREKINVRDFIQRNYTPYEGDEAFLAGPTDKTLRLWKQVESLFPQEIAKGVYDVDASTPSTIVSHKPGFISEEDDVIVGLQTDAPLKRAILPGGGWRMVENALETYGYPVDPALKKVFTEVRKTHNAAVFDVYTPEIRAARSSHLLTGLPDSYARGRIIGDYRRVALYGVDRLIEQKKLDKASRDHEGFSEDLVRFREEHSEQIRALEELKTMAASYGFDISRPAENSREALQWLYFGYLGAIKEQNGAAMSVGRIASFLDVFFQRDLSNGVITESQVQELVDNFVIKLRMVRFLRTPEYDSLFSGDPIWATLTLAGMGEDGRTLVTKSDFRILQTLRNLGPAPEPNITVLWNSSLPEGFKKFSSAVSVESSAIQYESDEQICSSWSDDTAIACCVSPLKVGEHMQFFGARANALKMLLYSMNEGRDEVSGKLVAEGIQPLEHRDVLDFDEVWSRFDMMMDWVARVYVHALNLIHYMHDKYFYERLEMALHDKDVFRSLATGLAGLSLVADSLSAIKYAKVHPVYDERGIIVDYVTEGDFPMFGNDDDRVDSLASKVVESFMSKLRQQPTYRNSVISMSVLSITSNVVYGKATGADPSGRRAGEPFAPGANPMNGRDSHGVVASALSVAKIPYSSAQDGISLTSTITPGALGRTRGEQTDNLAAVLDATFDSNLYHMNVNVLNKETLLDAMENPQRYPGLTIRVSGYAVHFARLTREQQLDVISRTAHASM